MKEEDLVREMLGARVKYYRSITYVLLALVSVCVLSLAGTIYFDTHTEKEVTTLFISLTAGLFGSLLTLVTQGVQAARRLRSDEELALGAEQVTFDNLKKQGVIPEDAKMVDLDKKLPNVELPNIEIMPKEGNGSDKI